MKKKIKTISLLLAVSLCLSLFGCDYINEWMGKNGEQNVGESDDIVDGNHSYHELFPDGYTGGFRHQPGANIEYWWVETYEEAIEAIELLKSHGSTFSDEMILTYEGDEFDTKYCFTITGVGAKTEKIKWGDNPFDRYAENVRISCFAFFEDVTIDEINHSYIYDRHTRYKAYGFGINNASEENLDNSSQNEPIIGKWIGSKKTDLGDSRYVFRVYYNEQNGTYIFIGTCFYLTEDEVKELKMTEECINDLINSSKVIDLRVEE